jgi:hypothetical protein
MRSSSKLSECIAMQTQRIAEVRRWLVACRWGVGLTMKAKTIAYRTTTVLIASLIGSGGVAQLVQFQGNVHGVVPVFGYPIYFFAILGF